jgi:hypothetical protein
MFLPVPPEVRDRLSFHRFRQVEKGIVTRNINALCAHLIRANFCLINGLPGSCNRIGPL